MIGGKRSGAAIPRIFTPVFVIDPGAGGKPGGV